MSERTLTCSVSQIFKEDYPLQSDCVYVPCLVNWQLFCSIVLWCSVTIVLATNATSSEPMKGNICNFGSLSRLKTNVMPLVCSQNIIYWHSFSQPFLWISLMCEKTVCFPKDLKKIYSVHYSSSNVILNHLLKQSNKTKECMSNTFL